MFTEIFFGTETFFEKFRIAPKGAPSFASIFCNRMDAKKSQRVPFCIFRHCDTVQKSQFLIFSNSPNGPFIFFLIFQQTGVSKSPKGPLFTILKTWRFLRLRYSADFGRSRLVKSNIKEIKDQFPAKSCRLSWARPRILQAQMLQYDVNK